MRTPVFVSRAGGGVTRGAAVLLLSAGLAAPGCGRKPEEAPKVSIRDDATAGPRARMVETQIVARGVRDPRVLAAMRKVPRHLFVAPAERARAYEDQPVPIGDNQTISQPYIVALMTELLELPPRSRVLEIGTGSGYQSAVLGELASEVYSIEILPELARSAGEKLRELGYANVVVREGDGYHGWTEHAPFDAIVLTAAPEQMPLTLVEQLALGGRLVGPIGGQLEGQELVRLRKREDGQLETERLISVRFVPMTPAPLPG